MKKIFLSYRHSGNNKEELAVALRKVEAGLGKIGYEVFCPFWQSDFFTKNGYSVQDIYAYCLDKLRESDLILFFVRSEDKSKRMDLELELAVRDGKKRVVLIQRDLLYPELRSSADLILDYSDDSELESKLSDLEFLQF